MAITGSGQVSLADLQTEFGGSAPTALSEYYRNGSAGVPNGASAVPESGEIQFSDFYGTSAYTPTAATGGSTADVTISGRQFRVHTFTSSGTFAVTTAGTEAEVEFVLVAGGGTGGNKKHGGGGGAGGYISSVVGEQSGANSSVVSKPSISDSTNYTITIGAGNSNMSNGSNSSAFGSTAIGGGRGASDGGGAATSGGSGGGGGAFESGPGSGTANQGNSGGSSGPTSGVYPAGGGGGSQSAGANGSGSSGGNGGALSLIHI